MSSWNITEKCTFAKNVLKIVPTIPKMASCAVFYLYLFMFFFHFASVHFSWTLPSADESHCTAARGAG